MPMETSYHQIGHSMKILKSDPNAEYVSVEEAKEIYDFAPSSLEESQSGLAYQSPTLQKHAVSPLWSW